MYRILVIEDEKNIRETLVDLLETQGYETLEAQDGEIGSIRAVRFKPDLILCDVNMPKMNGFEMLEVLNNCMEEEAVPLFIFLTARVEKKDMRKGMDLGADDYLIKPFSNIELLKIIKSKLEKRQRIEARVVHKERDRISGELHDSAQQLLVAAQMGLKSLVKKIDILDVKDQNTFKTSLELLIAATKDIREVSHEIITNQPLEEGLEKKIKNIIEPVQNSGSIDFKFDYSLERKLSEEKEIGLLRMVQECINNILKHAEASQVTISIAEQNGNCQVTIRDNGIGFDVKKKAEGIGMKSLEKRAQELSGSIDIDSISGKGTSIRISIP